MKKIISIITTGVLATSFAINAEAMNANAATVTRNLTPEKTKELIQALKFTDTDTYNATEKLAKKLCDAKANPSHQECPAKLKSPSGCSCVSNLINMSTLKPTSKDNGAQIRYYKKFLKGKSKKLKIKQKILNGAFLVDSTKEENIAAYNYFKKNNYFQATPDPTKMYCNGKGINKKCVSGKLINEARGILEYKLFNTQ